MRKVLTTLLLICAALLAGVQTSSAQTIEASTTAPTSGGADIVNLTDIANAANGTLDFSNNPPPGQSFTTGANPLGYYLTAIVVQGSGEGTANSGNGYQADTFGLGVYSNSTGNELLYQGGGNYTFANQTTGATATDYASDYLTFNLSTPILLAPNTTYVYALNDEDESGQNGAYFGFASTDVDSPSTLTGHASNNDPIYSGTDTYAGGTALNTSLTSDTDPDTESILSFTSDSSYDRDFQADLTAIPEPQTWALFGMGLATFAFVLRRHRHAV